MCFSTACTPLRHACGMLRPLHHSLIQSGSGNAISSEYQQQMPNDELAIRGPCWPSVLIAGWVPRSMSTLDCFFAV